MPIHPLQSLDIDTNIWIYLYYCGLVDAAFKLGSLHVLDPIQTRDSDVATDVESSRAPRNVILAGF